MASFERQAKIIYMNDRELMILSLSEVKSHQIDAMPDEEMVEASQIVLSNVPCQTVQSIKCYFWPIWLFFNNPEIKQFD